MEYVDVYVEHSHLNLNQTFTYQTTFDVKAGCRVKVPFGNQTVIGFVEAVHGTKVMESCRDVIAVIDEQPLLNDELMKLATWMSKYYVCSKISCLKTLLPPALKPSSTHAAIIYEDWFIRTESTHPLTSRQRDVLESTSFPIKASVFRKRAKSIAKKLLEYGYISIQRRKKQSQMVPEYTIDPSFSLTDEQKQAITQIQDSSDSIYLLHGVTGSGKTEVFLQLADTVLRQGKQVLFLVPEIGLTPMMIERIRTRFGQSIAIYHSHLNSQEKYNQYCLVRDRKVRIVVGTRSAVFMPFHDLGLILMDEEHDLSYKQDNMPRYHTRDIVIWRSRYHQCKVVLASATPSLDSYARAYKNKYHLITLKHRVYVNMPVIHLVDMKKQPVRYGISKRLQEEIMQRLEKKEQSILLLNRRGYLPVVRCASCQAILNCPDCGTALSYHKHENQLICHCCGRTFVYTDTCPNCGGHDFYQTTMGTEKLEEKMNELFPGARIMRMDADSTRKKNAHARLLETFATAGDILLGTQMVAKGLDFPKVTLVGVINADASLMRMDFSSNEIAYDLLEQASGRSGRKKQCGDVFIQTYDPKQYVMQCVRSHNYEAFFSKEMQFRHLGSYPPYVYMCTVIYSHTNEEKADRCAQSAKKFLAGFKVVGPIRISMRQKRRRVRIVVKSKDHKVLNQAMWALVEYHRSLKTNVEQDINMYPLVLEG